MTPIFGHRLPPRPLLLAALLALALALGLDAAEARPRARDLGTPFDGAPGPHNAITDVAGVTVGHSTVIRGEGALEVGRGPVRTGVTAVFPLGRDTGDGVAAGLFRLNGTGELTGSHLIEEAGLFFGPVLLTNTWSVGTAHQALLAWSRESLPRSLWFSRSLPVVAETADLPLNDMYGQHLEAAHVVRALEEARGGAVAEGNVGGGTGMVAFGFKGGIGTASRVVRTGAERLTVGVLVQSNFGSRRQLSIAGVPVGRLLANTPTPPAPPAGGGNSLIVIVATDAPLAPGQLERLARRAALGTARVGNTAASLSGELILAFSTTHRGSLEGEAPARLISNLETGLMDRLFASVVEATEEAIVNQLVASETMTGADGVTVPGLPHAPLVELLERFGRLR